MRLFVYGFSEIAQQGVGDDGFDHAQNGIQDTPDGNIGDNRFSCQFEVECG